jgi:hypothetical protein
MRFSGSLKPNLDIVQDSVITPVSDLARERAKQSHEARTTGKPRPSKPSQNVPFFFHTSFPSSVRPSPSSRSSPPLQPKPNHPDLQLAPQGHPEFPVPSHHTPTSPRAPSGRPPEFPLPLQISRARATTPRSLSSHLPRATRDRIGAPRRPAGTRRIARRRGIPSLAARRARPESRVPAPNSAASGGGRGGARLLGTAARGGISTPGDEP